MSCKPGPSCRTMSKSDPHKHHISFLKVDEYRVNSPARRPLLVYCGMLSTLWKGSIPVMVIVIHDAMTDVIVNFNCRVHRTAQAWMPRATTGFVLCSPCSIDSCATFETEASRGGEAMTRVSHDRVVHSHRLPS